MPIFRRFLLLSSLIIFSIAPTIQSDAQATLDREILRLGRGTANALDWHPDGDILAVGEFDWIVAVGC